jgi:glycosyltransferase involved in cell wall biosynthesis
VRFAGNLDYDGVGQRLARAHAFLFPTARDIWGLVLVEAMAAGLPCLASVKAGATRDLVVEGETGFALDFEDTGRVAERLAELRADPGRLEELGAAGRRRVRDRFTLEHSARGWVEMVGQWE